LAAKVKARGARRRVRSDWMAVERERGISVSSAVMSFEHEGLALNLLDTPGQQDFSPMGFQRGQLSDLAQPIDRQVAIIAWYPRVGTLDRSGALLGGSWRYLIST